MEGIGSLKNTMNFDILDSFDYFSADDYQDYEGRGIPDYGEPRIYKTDDVAIVVEGAPDNRIEIICSLYVYNQEFSQEFCTLEQTEDTLKVIMEIINEGYLKKLLNYCRVNME